MSNEQVVQTQEELEAAFEEGIAPISDEAMELVERIREIKKLIAPLEVEKKALQELIIEEMEHKHVNKLSKDGVVQVENIITHPTKTDTKGLLEAYPEIMGVYIYKGLGTRFDVKK